MCYPNIEKVENPFENPFCRPDQGHVDPGRPFGADQTGGVHLADDLPDPAAHGRIMRIGVTAENRPEDAGDAALANPAHHCGAAAAVFFLQAAITGEQQRRDDNRVISCRADRAPRIHGTDGAAVNRDMISLFSSLDGRHTQKIIKQSGRFGPADEQMAAAISCQFCCFMRSSSWFHSGYLIQIFLPHCSEKRTGITARHLTCISLYHAGRPCIISSYLIMHREGKQLCDAATSSTG